MEKFIKDLLNDENIILLPIVIFYALCLLGFVISYPIALYYAVKNFIKNL